MSWLVDDLSVRKQLIKALARCGIDMVRERFYWSHVNPQPGVWKNEGSGHYATTRAAYQKSGIKVMELVYASVPGWFRNADTPWLPNDVIKATASVHTIAVNWSGSTGALEIWNEPEGNPSGTPADYMPLLKSVYWDNAAAGNKIKVGGPAFAYNNKSYVQQCLDNGLAQTADFISFHYYGKVPGLEDVVRQYRQQAGGIPLWLTEVGKSWKFGPPRPPLDQDMLSAREISMLAAEAKACGVARAFAFVLPYIEVGHDNFGMTGKNHTPLRALAAYMQMVGVLSHKNYIGDIKTGMDKAVQRTRVFAHADDVVAVLYGEPAPSISLPVELCGLAYEGMDGRALQVDAGNNLPFGDGLVYIRTVREQISSFLNADTPTMSLLKQATPEMRPTKLSPVILQPGAPDKNIATRKTEYQIQRNQAGDFSLNITMNNLSDSEETVCLELQNPSGTLVRGPKQQSLQLSPKGNAGASWKVGFERDAPVLGQYSFQVRGTDAEDGRILPVSFTYSIMAELEDYLKEGKQCMRLDIFDAKKWKDNHGAGVDTHTALTPEGHWQIKTRCLKGADRWCFPKLTLDHPINDWTAQSRLVIRGRCKNGAPMLLLWEDDGALYLTMIPIFPADGEWHTARIAYDDFSMFPGTPDDDQVLNLDKLSELSVGLSPREGESELEVSDLYIINTGKAGEGHVQ